MSNHVNPRSYKSTLRTEQAARTRSAIVDAARKLLITEGYARTTVHGIAQLAGVHVDTIYRSVGRKPELLRAVLESALSGTTEAIPAAERDYVIRIRAARTAGEKIDIYADAITGIQQRLAPVFLALRGATHAGDLSLELWNDIAERRARNMRDFARDLRSTGELRADLDDDTVADILWSMNATEYWDLLVERRKWPPQRFRDWLADAWRRLLLASPGEDRLSSSREGED